MRQDYHALRAEAGRLFHVLDGTIRACDHAVERYGSRQLDMAIEECGELITALARYERGRATSADVLGEVADVIITAIQVGIIHGDSSLSDLVDAIAAKTARLDALLARGEMAGG